MGQKQDIAKKLFPISELFLPIYSGNTPDFGKPEIMSLYRLQEIFVVFVKF